MVKNHFIIGYFGNKREEFKDIYEFVKDDLENPENNIKCIIEPYAGTAAFSCFLSKLKPKKYKYILNDRDNYLIELFQVMKDDEKLNNFIDKINLMCFNDNNQFMTKEQYRNLPSGFERWFIHNRFMAIRSGLYPLRKMNKLNKDNILKLEILRFLRNEEVEFMNTDAMNLLIPNLDNKEVLFFMDPPYLLAENGYYDLQTEETKKENIYEFIARKSDLINCKIMGIFEYNWLIELLFNNEIWKKSTSHPKIYQGSKKKTFHKIIKNF